MYIILLFILFFLIYYFYILYKYKIFVINLTKRNDRLNFFKEFYSLPIKYNVFNAVDGNSLKINDLFNKNIINNNILNNIKNNTNRKYHYEINTKGAIGCYLSHVNLWKYIVNNNIKYAIIFEDDCKVSNISLINIDIRLNILPDNWNIYLLNDISSKYDIELVYNKLYKVKRFFGLVAYIINYNTAKLLINNTKLFPINQHLDSYLSELSLDYNLNIYIHNYKNFSWFNSITDIHVNENNTLKYDRLQI